MPLTAFTAAHGQDDLNSCPKSTIKQFLDDRDLVFITSAFLEPDAVLDIKRIHINICQMK